MNKETIFNIMKEIETQCYDNGDSGASDMIKINNILEKHLLKEEEPKNVIKGDFPGIKDRGNVEEPKKYKIELEPMITECFTTYNKSDGTVGRDGFANPDMLAVIRNIEKLASYINSH